MPWVLRGHNGQEHCKDTRIHKHQLDEDKMGEQLKIPLKGDPFTGSR